MTKTILLCLGLAAATITTQALTVLSTDFTGVTRSTTPTATGITWTQGLGLSIDTPALTIISEYGGGAPVIRTDNNADRIGVDYNIETGGGRSWSTEFTFTTTNTLNLTAFSVDYYAISGGGATQIESKNGDFSFSLFSGVGVGGAELFTETKVELVDAGGANVAAATYDLSSLDDLAAGTYTIKLQVEAGNEDGGNNWGMDEVVFTADIPEPSSAVLLLGLGGLALVLRRRK